MFIIKFHEREESSSVILRRINNYEWTIATIQVAGYIYTFVLNTLTIGIFVFKNITYKRETQKFKKNNNNNCILSPITKEKLKGC